MHKFIIALIYSFSLPALIFILISEPNIFNRLNMPTEASELLLWSLVLAPISMLTLSGVYLTSVPTKRKNLHITVFSLVALFIYSYFVLIYVTNKVSNGTLITFLLMNIWTASVLTGFYSISYGLFLLISSTIKKQPLKPGGRKILIGVVIIVSAIILVVAINFILYILGIGNTHDIQLSTS